MKGKRFVVFLAFLIAASMLFAAGGRDTGTQTVHFWFWGPVTEPMYGMAVRDFEAQNPGIKVQKTLTPWSDYWTKLQTALPAGTGPDVFWINHPNLSTYFPTGLLLDLEPAAADIKFENFNPSFLVPFTSQGKRYGVPINYDIIVLMYNKEMFDKAGVAYPTDNWTWNDYREAAGKLTIKDGATTVQYGCIASWDFQGGVANQMYQNGGRIFDNDRMRLVINSPENREAIQEHLDLIYRYGYAPTPQVISELGGLDQMFAAEQAAMHITRNSTLTWFSQTLGSKIGVAPNPKQKQRASILHSIAYVASSKTRTPDATRKLMAFFASKQHADQINTVWEPCFNGYGESFYSKFPGVNPKIFTDALSYSFPLPVANRNGGSVYTMMNDEMQKIYMNPQLGDALANFERMINAEIAK